MAINLIDMVKPKGDFPIAVAEDIELADGTRLDAQPIMRVVTELPDDASEHPNVLYLVVEDEDPGGGDAP